MEKPFRDPGASAAERLQVLLSGSPIIDGVLDRWGAIELPNCWLSGSVVAQTAWNVIFGYPPEHGIADVDLVYFDPADLSEESEGEQEERLKALLSDVPSRIDAKNEARVHLWYEAKFGYPIDPYRSSEHAISTFPTTAGAVAIRPASNGLDIYAPFGLDDLLNCAVRPNKMQITEAIYVAKAKRWRSCWPKLKITKWHDQG